jgi:hypothetical protein
MTDTLITPEGEKLAREALRRIDLNPESWDQTTFGSTTACGTVACLAGHVIMAAGGEPSTDLGDYVLDGQTRFAADLARELLGINRASAEVLFAANNDREDLEQLVNDLAAGKRVDCGCPCSCDECVYAGELMS